MPSSLVQRKLLYAILLRSLQMNVGHLGPAAVVGHHIVAGLEYFDRRLCLLGWPDHMDGHAPKSL